jgi:hypothetical protein
MSKRKLQIDVESANLETLKDVAIHLERELIQSKENNKQEAQGPHRSPESYWLIFRI